MRSRTLLSALFFLALSASAAHADPNVIFVTLDGVRWQEIFHGIDPEIAGPARAREELFPFLKSTLGQAVLFGDKAKGERARVANPMSLSLPGYMSLLAGSTQWCFTNNCSRIKAETFPERIRRELALPATQVATIASWSAVGLAAEAVEGATLVNAGRRPLDDGAPDEELEMINRLQAADTPPWSSRWDRYTTLHAMRYLKKHRPRMLYVSFNDADDWAHIGNYPMYLNSLRRYDAWLKELFETLQSMGAYGEETTVIVTTDHGRGKGAKGWRDHGWKQLTSNQVWFYAYGPGTRANRGIAPRKFSHHDVRPTVETILGLRPQGSNGRVMTEILTQPRQ